MRRTVDVPAWGEAGKTCEDPPVSEGVSLPAVINCHPPFSGHRIIDEPALIGEQPPTSGLALEAAFRGKPA